MMVQRFDLSAQQKAADITCLIVRGAAPTTAEIAERYGITWQGAYMMMSRISGVVPLIQDGQRWRLFTNTTGV